MTFFWLNAITASRLVFCGPIWLWCWWKRPTWMVLWMTLDFAYFLVTDHLDGQWARRYGLVSELGFWLDHLGDFVFYGCVVLTLFLGSREPAARKPGAMRERATPPSTREETPPKAPNPPAP